MKRLTRVALISAVLHFIYVIATFGIGFLRTLTYEPDIIAEANHVVVLQDKVVIGMTGTPFLYVFTWIGLALVLGLGRLVFKDKRAKSIQINLTSTSNV
ncbi:hypothetical protein [Exiguobacterium alkaliphilum]|uniref:hypothetical protein n=1 Tax=Exiguobacterium alkaliphilum TaxID=1428684 RepID=UPI001BAD4784|nr:hypothetical protein [Exiguobacterium alkaliphilum]QUE86650.1 hypothetical protein KB235_01530 [Exiguobacterium alkaliphilum]